MRSVGRQRVILDQVDEAVHDLAQIVGRDVRGHAHRDARGPVDQKCGEDGGKNRGLFESVVVVRLELDGLFVEIGHHGGGDLGEARFGVAHGGRAVAIDGAEVPLAIHQDGPHVEVLRHANEGVVDRGVAVRVVLAHDIADDARALPKGLSGDQADLVHGVQHATVRRLHAIAHVGQGATDDHRHGVVHVGLLHLVGDVDRYGDERVVVLGHCCGFAVLAFGPCLAVVRSLIKRPGCER